MNVDLTLPQAVIAQHYMRKTKGIKDAEPHDVIKLDGVACWYFYYSLPQGTLELEVFWDEELEDWLVTVTAFPVAL